MNRVGHPGHSFQRRPGVPDMLVALMLLAVLWPASAALGQVRPGRDRIEARLNAPAAERFALADTLTRFRTRAVPGGRIDEDSGVLRASYRIQVDPAIVGGDVEASARRYLAREAGAFGFDPSLQDLVLVTRVEGERSSHLTFQQVYRGIPVYNRTVRVNLDARRAPTQVLSGYAPALAPPPGTATAPSRSPDEIVTLARVFVRGDMARHTPPEPVVIPDPFRLAWRLVAWGAVSHAEWEILVDDATGEPIQVRDLSTHAHVHPAGGSSAGKPRPARSVPQVSVASVTGQGYVFDPDPLTTSGAAYGPPYADSDDEDVPELNNQRVLVNLPDITLGGDGFYRLDGPHVRIVGESPAGNVVYDPPAEALLDGFRYGRSDDAFEAVNVYYHVDKSQRHVKSLDIGRPIQDRAISINPHGLGNEDNSRFYPTLNYIAFGAGGVDDAEDAFVIWHEYGHALLQESAPGLLDGTEGRALHEGWADYWAASYARSLAEQGLVPRNDWQNFFKWDSGDGEIWAGRRLAFQGVYPTATLCDDRPFACDIYADGMLWAVAQMSVYDVLGRTITDRLNLASHAYLMHPVTFRDAAEAVIQADIDLYGGEHVSLLFELFDQRGLIEHQNFSPLVIHTPITWVEELGGAVSFEVSAVGVSSEIDHVTIRYGFGGILSEQLTLAPIGDDRYAGAVDMPAESGTVVYAVEVLDKGGLMSRLPAIAEETRYSFTLGPDTEPPTLTHEPLGVIALADWPPAVSVQSTDNLGVDSVTVAFRIVDPVGRVIADSSFGLVLAEGVYSASFPVSVAAMSPASVVSYRILARDQALVPNTATAPAEGFFSFSIVSEGGVLRYYDFEAAVEGIEADGSWQRDTPTYGTHFAYSGDQLWGTNPRGAYDATAGRSTLQLPPLRVSTAGDTYLVFWHYYDTEHDGTAGPGRATLATLWDGGNVKVSTDTGSTWAVLQPVGGYDGTIATGSTNPMGGEPGFGGFSYGWQRALFHLPIADEVLIRFDFGTDAENDGDARVFAGWYLDDVTVLGEPPVDDTRPQASVLPPALQVLGPGQLLPDLYVEATDNVGVRSVEALYTAYTSADVREGTVRLVMSEQNPQVFQAPFALAGAASRAVGDSLAYRVRVTDFDGNTAIYPASGQPAFRIEYRLQEAIELAADAVATGVWSRDGEEWVVHGDGSAPVRSSLVFAMQDLPTNVDQLSLFLLYRVDFSGDERRGMNVKVSEDGGASWDLLEPVGGYDEALSEGPLAGEPVFRGGATGLQQATFDLVERRGRQLMVRIDAAAGVFDDTEDWRLSAATLRYATLETVDGGFDIPRELALHANYPDPFAASTTIGYTLPDDARVELVVYDMLGRVRARLVDGSQPAGTYTLSFAADGLASGVYLLRLDTPMGSRVERMIVTR